MMHILNQASEVPVALRAPHSYRGGRIRTQGKPGIDTGRGRDGEGENWTEERQGERRPSHQ